MRITIVVALLLATTAQGFSLEKGHNPAVVEEPQAAEKTASHVQRGRNKNKRRKMKARKSNAKFVRSLKKSQAKTKRVVNELEAHRQKEIKAKLQEPVGTGTSSRSSSPLSRSSGESAPSFKERQPIRVSRREDFSTGSVSDGRSGSPRSISSGSRRSFDDLPDYAGKSFPTYKNTRPSGYKHEKRSHSFDLPLEGNPNKQEADLYARIKHKDTTISDRLGYVADSQGRTADLIGGSHADYVGDNADSPKFGTHGDEANLDKFAHRHDYVGEDAPKLTCQNLPYPYGPIGKPGYYYDYNRRSYINNDGTPYRNYYLPYPYPVILPENWGHRLTHNCGTGTYPVYTGIAYPYGTTLPPVLQEAGVAVASEPTEAQKRPFISQKVEDQNGKSEKPKDEKKAAQGKVATAEKQKQVSADSEDHEGEPAQPKTKTISADSLVQRPSSQVFLQIDQDYKQGEQMNEAAFFQQVMGAQANAEYPAPILSRSSSKAGPPAFDLIDEGTVELDDQGEPTSKPKQATGKQAPSQKQGTAESQLLFLNDLESEMKQ